LPDFIETIYRKHFKKNRPDNIRSIEQMANEKRRKKAAKNSEKAIGTDEKMPEPALVADAFGRRQDSD
jgi:hypothetical protein